MKEWTNNVWVPLAFLPPAAELDTNLFTQVTRKDLVNFHFWIGPPEHPLIRLGTFHSVIGYYPELLFPALDRRWLRPTLWCCGVTLNPSEVQGTLLSLEVTGLEPGMLDWLGASGEALSQEIVLFHRLKV